MSTPPIVFKIDSTGTTRFLVNADTESFLTQDAVIRRASFVRPANRLLWWLFEKLRTRYGEAGRVAEFTRRWPCLWKVDLSPSGGPVLAGAWRDRQEAIRAEIRWVNQFGL